VTSLETPAPPHSWWTVDTVELGSLTLYYRLGPRRPIRDERGRWVRDKAGRTALEAFGSLPLGEMYGRLRAAEEAWLGTDPATRDSIVAADPERESRRQLTDLTELVSFVHTFGPLGFEWSRTFPVRNSAADRALDELSRRRIADVIRATGGSVTDEAFAPARRDWQVAFPSPGFSMPIVREAYVHPGKSWAERVRLGDDAIPRDYLGPQPTGPLWGHQDDLRRVLELVNVLSATDPNPHEIRNAAGNLPGDGEFDVSERGVRDPVDLLWREAMRRPRASGGRWWSPFREHPSRVDWVTAGRLMLANYLSAQLAWTTIEAGIDELGRIRTRWTPHSLLEIIYLQLLEHVQERLQFGVGRCLHCGGPILRTRLSERTRNRAHAGCAALLRKRRQRERERDDSAAGARS